MVYIAFLPNYSNETSILFNALNKKYGIDLILSNTPSNLNTWKNTLGNSQKDPLSQSPNPFPFNNSFNEIVQHCVSNYCNIVIQLNKDKSVYPNMIVINCFNIHQEPQSKLGTSGPEYLIYEFEVLTDNDTEILNKKLGFSMNTHLKSRFSISFSYQTKDLVQDNELQNFLNFIYNNNSSMSMISQNENLLLFKAPIKNSKQTPTTLFNLPYKYKKTVYIYPSCNWQSNSDLVDNWTKFNCIPEIVQFTKDKSKSDYHMIINSTNETFDPSKTLYFCMEPHMDKSPHFANFYNRMINDKNLMFCGTHEYHVNNTEWHLSPSYKQLSELNIPFKKYDKVLSVIVSNKNYDEGHKLRLNFIRYLDSCATLPFELHIYGSADLKFKNYKGALPPNKKDAGIFPYKYHFNAENNSIKNYITEKFTDSVLGECLTFYWGCPNIDDYYDSNCSIRLSLKPEDLQKDIQKISDAMNKDEWSVRLPVIKNMKSRILNEYNMFVRIKKILEISNTVVFVNISKEITEKTKDIKGFMYKLENILNRQGFSRYIFIQLQTDIQLFNPAVALSELPSSERTSHGASESTSTQLMYELLSNFIKCGENIVFINIGAGYGSGTENVFNDVYKNLSIKLSRNREVSRIVSLGEDTPKNLSELLSSPFYISNETIEILLLNQDLGSYIKNKNMWSSLEKFIMKNN